MERIRVNKNTIHYTPSKSVVKRTSKSRTQKLSLHSILRFLHSILAPVNRFTFYFYLIVLPFNIEFSIPFASYIKIQLSWLCLLITLMLWLPTKLIEPRIKWLWGWWYAVLPLILLVLLQSPQTITAILSLIALYWFIINEIPERVYWEVGLTFSIMVFVQSAVVQGRLANVELLISADAKHLILVEAFVPLGLALAGRHWISNTGGLLVAAPVIAIVLLTFPIMGVSLLVAISVMLLQWLGGRRRMRSKLIPLIAVLETGTVIAIIAGVPQEVIIKIINSLSSWQAHAWLGVLVIALPPIAALTRQFLGLMLPILFISILVVLYLTYFELLNSLNVSFRWLRLSLGAAFVFVSIIQIFGLLNRLFGRKSPFQSIMYFWLLRSGLRVFGAIALSGGMLILILPIFGIIAYLVWPLQTVIILGCLVVGWMMGMAATVLLDADLNVGSGVLLLMIFLIVVSLAAVTEASQIICELLPLIVAMLVAIGTWRSQRMWTVALSASLIGACLLMIIRPNIWFTAPQSIIFTVLLGLWVDKSNIPIGISIFKLGGWKD